MNISIDPMGTDPMDTEANMPFALPLHQVAASRMGSGTLTAAEAEERYQCALELEKHIKLSNKKFHLRLDHVAAILLADLQEIREGGRLWAGPPCGVAPYLMERRLNAISPLCRHYMLHLDPKNLVLPIWRHAVPVPLEPQPSPRDVPREAGVEAYKKAVAYYIRFRTKPHLQSVPLDKQRMEEAECRKRDGNKCVVTGELNPRIFWIIPSTWNDTVEHMNATGNLHSACIALTGIDLLDEPNPPCSALELGTTHKSWNMLCIDPVLYNYLIDGLCAFKYLSHQEDINNSNNVKVTLEFNWMPRLASLFGLGLGEDFGQEWHVLCMKMRKLNNCPPPSLEYGQVRTKFDVRSGHCIDIPVPKQYVHQFVSGIKVHWAFIQFMALCGAAGRPWLFSDGDPMYETVDMLEFVGLMNAKVHQANMERRRNV